MSQLWLLMCDYLAGLWSVKDVYGAGLDPIGFGSLVKGKPAFPSPSVSIGEWAIVPVKEEKSQHYRTPYEGKK